MHPARLDEFRKPANRLPLTRQYGWGAHYDGQGRIAIYAVESKGYQRIVNDKSLRKFSAMRSKRQR